MFTVNEDLSIHATRGDIVFFDLTADAGAEKYRFKTGDIVRMTIYGKKDAENVVMQKDFPVFEEADSIPIFLGEEDTRIGSVISKPVDYWYEIELNPDTYPQTIIGYDENGAKVFRIYPEGDS
jgi:protein involved in polysaccharide export with SLBB domain